MPVPVHVDRPAVFHRLVPPGMNSNDPYYIEQRTAVRNYEQRKEVLKNIGTTRTIARFVRDLFWKGRK